MPTAIIGGVAKTRIMRRIGNGSTSYPSRAALHPSYVIRIVSDLKTTMEKAGVKGTPQVWFATSAAK